MVPPHATNVTPHLLLTLPYSSSSSLIVINSIHSTHLSRMDTGGARARRKDSLVRTSDRGRCQNHGSLAPRAGPIIVVVIRTVAAARSVDLATHDGGRQFDIESPRESIDPGANRNQKTTASATVVGCLFGYGCARAAPGRNCGGPVVD
jgi:hypothetical protein